MLIDEAHKKIDAVEKKLIAIKKQTAVVKKIKDQGESEDIAQNKDANIAFPKQNKLVLKFWDEIKNNAPSGFVIQGNLLRHLSFNMVGDWIDIHHSDIGQALESVKEYRKKLAIVEYLSGLNPEISKVSSMLLDGEIDVALKAVFATLDTKIRAYLSITSRVSTVPAIGKAFNEGILKAPDSDNNDSARNFLQGVVGYYRSNILHRSLPTNRNNIEASASLFCLAHEAFTLFAFCSN